jgi:hypothetical protein
MAEEALTAAFGEDDEPSFEVFLEWVVVHADRPPGRPRGSRDRNPTARQRRVDGWQRCRQRASEARYAQQSESESRRGGLTRVFHRSARRQTA